MLPLPPSDQLSWGIQLTPLQKDAWTTTISILQSSTEAEAQLFAATTLKGKVWSLDIPGRRGAQMAYY